MFGIAGPGIIKEDLDAFKELGIFSMVRGRRGAGVFQAKSVGSPKIKEDLYNWYKVSDSWNDLLDRIKSSKSCKTIMETCGVDVLMGHVRWPTRGSVDIENTHPFEFDNLVGMHNGTLKDFKYFDKDQTDSELMFEEIDRKGIAEVLDSMDKDSAYAISMYDRNKDKLIFARNSKRTLSFTLLEERSVLYWASEAGFLKCVLDRHGIKYKNMYSLKENKVFEVTPSKISHKDHNAGIEIVHEVKEKEGKELENFRQQFREANQEKTTKKVTQHQQPKNNVVHISGHPRVSLPPTPKVVKRGQSLKSFYSQCFCGTRTMNLRDTHLSKCGEPGFPKWNHVEGKFYCDDCLENIVNKKEVVM